MTSPGGIMKNIKIRKSFYFYAGLAIVIIGIVWAILVYSQQIQEQKRLTTELDSVQQRLSNLGLVQLTAQKDNVQIRIDQSNFELETISQKVTLPNDSITVNERLFALAHTYNVFLSSTVTSDTYVSSLDDITCYLTSISLNIKGNLDDIVTFITSLDTGCPNNIIESIGISISDSSPADSTSASLKLTVYSYKGKQ